MVHKNEKVVKDDDFGNFDEPEAVKEVGNDAVVEVNTNGDDWGNFDEPETT